MCGTTHRQQAKQLHSSLVEQGIVDLFYEGLLGDKIWVSKNSRAYPLPELADSHLENIVKRFKQDGDIVPRAIQLEQLRRDAEKTQTFIVTIEKSKELGPEFTHQVTIIKGGERWTDKWQHEPTLSEAIKVYEDINGEQ